MNFIEHLTELKSQQSFLKKLRIAVDNLLITEFDEFWISETIDGLFNIEVEESVTPENFDKLAFRDSDVAISLIDEDYEFKHNGYVINQNFTGQEKLTKLFINDEQGSYGYCYLFVK